MENDIFWDVFRDTGDPLCWLMSRAEVHAAEPKKEDTEDKEPARPLS